MGLTLILGRYDVLYREVNNQLSFTFTTFKNQYLLESEKCRSIGFLNAQKVLLYLGCRCDCLPSLTVFRYEGGWTLMHVGAAKGNVQLVKLLNRLV